MIAMNGSELFKGCGLVGSAEQRADIMIRSADLIVSLHRHALQVACCCEEAYSDEIPYREVLLDDISRKAAYLSTELRTIGYQMVYDGYKARIKESGYDADDFAEMFLDPDKKADDSGKEYISKLITREVIIDGTFDEEIAARIKQMPYSDFLKTPYWNIIADLKKAVSGSCVLCCSDKRLEVHHPTYEWHGYEHRHFNDLVVLCHDCHAKISSKK